jgi:hypothetical protein
MTEGKGDLFDNFFVLGINIQCSEILLGPCVNYFSSAFSTVFCCESLS